MTNKQTNKQTKHSAIQAGSVTFCWAETNVFEACASRVRQTH